MAVRVRGKATARPDTRSETPPWISVSISRSGWPDNRPTSVHARRVPIAARRFPVGNTPRPAGRLFDFATRAAFHYSLMR